MNIRITLIYFLFVCFAFAQKPFTGFNDPFKNQMAKLLGQITNAKTPQTKMLKDKLVIGLVSIDNTLTMINKDRNRERELKPILQKHVKNFLSDLDVVKKELTKSNNSVVIGNNNIGIGKVGLIRGNHNAVKGNKNAVVGSNNLLKGSKALVAGNSNKVKGDKGVTVGSNNKVSANNAYAFTNNDIVNRDHTLTVRNSTIDISELLKGNNKYIKY